jgi:hypothetical protein
MESEAEEMMAVLSSSQLRSAGKQKEALAVTFEHSHTSVGIASLLEMDAEFEDGLLEGRFGRSSGNLPSLNLDGGQRSSAESVESFGMEDWPVDALLDTGGYSNDDAVAGVSNTAMLSQTVRGLASEHIRSVFERFDVNSSGDLDTFELSSAVAELIGRKPSTLQVAAMVSAAGAEATNVLTIDQFDHLIRTFDWDSAATDSPLPIGLYEIVFQKERLGFRVRNVSSLETIVVSVIIDSELNGKMNVKDTVLAINGSPLGRVSDHKVNVCCCQVIICRCS